MKDTLKRKPGNVYFSPAHPKASPSDGGVPEGAPPSWSFESPDNTDSWREVFGAMACETKEFVLWTAGGTQGERLASPPKHQLLSGAPYPKTVRAPKRRRGGSDG